MSKRRRIQVSGWSRLSEGVAVDIDLGRVGIWGPSPRWEHSPELADAAAELEELGYRDVVAWKLSRAVRGPIVDSNSARYPTWLFIHRHR
jgi:hypothetical protein